MKKGKQSAKILTITSVFIFNVEIGRKGTNYSESQSTTMRKTSIYVMETAILRFVRRNTFDKNTLFV